MWKPLFPYYFLLIATMTKAMSANSQQLLIIILFLCEAISLNKINMNSLFLFILLIFYFIYPRSWQNNQALDSTLIFIIYSSRTRLHRGIIKQNSKLDHAIKAFILIGQDIIKRIELRKTVKIGVWWWYDTGAPPPSLAVAKGSAHTHVIISPSSRLVSWSSWRLCPSRYGSPPRAYWLVVWGPYFLYGACPWQTKLLLPKDAA